MQFNIQKHIILYSIFTTAIIAPLKFYNNLNKMNCVVTKELIRCYYISFDDSLKTDQPGKAVIIQHAKRKISRDIRDDISTTNFDTIGLSPSFSI